MGEVTAKVPFEPNRHRLEQLKRVTKLGRLPRLAILGSGGGTTAAQVIEATQTGVLRAKVGLVISNRSDAGIFKRVDRLNQQYGLDIQRRHISTRTLDVMERARRLNITAQQAEASMIAEACEPYDLVALLGYMKKLGGRVLAKPVVNTHPGPLPETAGEHGEGAQQKAIDLDLGFSAQTLHWVNEDYDQGEVIASHRVPFRPTDTAEVVNGYVMATEKSWLPVNLDQLLHDEVVTSS